MLSKFGSIRGAQQGTIDSQYVQTLPGIAVVALATLLATRLAEQPLHRIGPVVCAPPQYRFWPASREKPGPERRCSGAALLHGLARRETKPCQAPTRAPDRRADAAGSRPGRRGPARTRPTDWNVLSEGAQIGEVEQFTQVEQLLLERHKKIRCQKPGIGFRGSPAGAQMLK